MISASIPFSVIPRKVFEKAKQSPDRPRDYPCSSKGRVVLSAYGCFCINRAEVVPATCGKMNKSRTRVALCSSCSALTDFLLERLQNYRSQSGNSNSVAIDMPEDNETEITALNGTVLNAVEQQELIPLSDYGAIYDYGIESESGGCSFSRLFAFSTLFLAGTGLVLYSLIEAEYIPRILFPTEESPCSSRRDVWDGTKCVPPKSEDSPRQKISTLSPIMGSIETEVGQ